MKLHDPISAVLERKGYEIWTVAPTAPVIEAIWRMSEACVGALLVLDGNKLAGIVSERDYARKVILTGRSSRDTLVQEIMTNSVIFVTLDTTVDECMQLMTNNRIRHLPVLDEQAVIGVVSIGDLVQWIISAHEVMVDQLHNYITGRYPA